MDLKLTLHHGKIQSTLHEKEHNLYLYITPHSAHPKGMLNGLIFGNTLRIHRLCSNPQQIRHNINAFYQRLINHGYHNNVLTPIFRKATYNALAYLACSPKDHEKRRNDKTNKTKRTVFLHLQYHPQDPPAREIQQIWDNTVANPAGHPHINTMRNYNGATTPIDTLTIAYSRPPNLRHQFSVRTIKNKGREVSSFL